MSETRVGQALEAVAAAMRDLATVLRGTVGDAELLAVIAGLTRLENEGAALRIRVVNGLLQQRLCLAEASLPVDAGDELRERRIARTASRVTTDVALARQVPGYEAGRQVRTAQRLCHQLPRTLEQIATGGLTEARARIIAEGSVQLPEEVVAEFDERVATECVGKADRGVRNTVRGLTYRLDPRGTVARNRKAVGERYASTRPVAEGMAQLSIVAPMPQTIAAFASLSAHADALRFQGDCRSKAQIIADTAIARLTCGAVQGCSQDGTPLRWSIPTVPCPSTLDSSPTLLEALVDVPGGAGEDDGLPADDSSSLGGGTVDLHGQDGSDPPDFRVDDGEDPDAEVPILGPGAAAAPRLHLHLILTDQTLLGGDQSALLVGHGPIPAFVARQLAAMSADTATRARGVIRRYLTDPVSGRLTDCDPRARVFPRVMKEFLLVRDQVCRTPYCGSPIREFDHVVPYAQGGATTIDNAQGLCRRCNRAKEHAGWHQTADGDGTITTTTATGAALHSPEPPGMGRSKPPTAADSCSEARGLQPFRHGKCVEEVAAKEILV